MKYIMLAVFIYMNAAAFSQESFRLEWEIEDNLMPQGGIVDDEGNAVIVGLIRKPTSNNDMDAFIFQADTSGEFIYNRTIAPLDTSISYGDIIQISNGNYFTIGRKRATTDTASNCQDKLIVAIYNQDLTLEKYNEFSFNNTYKSIFDFHLHEKENGNIICASSSRKKDEHKYDLCLIELSNTGDTVQTMLHSYDNHVSRIHDIDPIPNSSNCLILESATDLNGHPECYILKPDLTAGNINSFYQNGMTMPGDLCCDYWYPDNTFLMATGTTILGKSSEKGLGVFRCDTLGSIIDQIFLNKEGIYDLNAFKKCMAFVDEGSIFIVGTMDDYGNCNSPDSIELYIIDTALNQVGYKSLGGDASYDITGVLTSITGDAIIYGKEYSPESNCYGNLVIYYISRGELGLPPVNVFHLETTINSPCSYPNPAKDLINIDIGKKSLGKAPRVRLYSSNGKKVYDHKLPNMGNIIQLDISKLEPNLYIYEVVGDSKTIIKGKFLKQ